MILVPSALVFIYNTTLTLGFMYFFPENLYCYSKHNRSYKLYGHVFYIERQGRLNKSGTYKGQPINHS